MSSDEKSAQFEELRDYLLEELKRPPLRQKALDALRFHLEQRPWLGILVPLIVVGELLRVSDKVGTLLVPTISALLVVLSLTLTSVTVLRAHYRILPSEIRELHDAATEIYAHTDQVRLKLLQEYPSDQNIRLSLSKTFASPPDVDTEYDLPNLLKYAYDLHKYVSNMLFLALPKGVIDSIGMHKLWGRSMNLVSRITASSGFVNVVAGPIDFVTISAPTAILSGLALFVLASSRSAMDPGGWLDSLFRIVYWTFLIATILEVALIVRRATRFAIGTAFEGQTGAKK